VVGTGVGICQGTEIFNSTAVTFTPGIPGIVSRSDRVVLVENNTNVAYTGAISGVILNFPTDLTDYSGAASVPPYTCRIAILRGNAITGAPTALVQSENYWMIELASYDISNVAVISNLVDRREFANIEKIVGVHSDDEATIEDALILGVEVNDDVGAAGLGVGIRAVLENDNGDLENAGQAAFRWTDASDGGEDARFELRLSAGNADNLSAVINAPAVASVDGNARGVGAVDLQQTRSAAAQVASGVYAHSEGNGNTASGAYAVAVGQGNVATDAYTKSSGYGAKAKVHGQVARSAYLDEPYRAQYSDYHIARTINHGLNTWAEVYLGPAANGLLLIAKQAMTFECLLVGVEGIFADTSCSFTFSGGVIRPSAGALVLTSGAVTLLHNNTVLTFEARADVAGANALRIEVRCTDGTPSMYWSGVVRAAEVFGNAVP